MSRNHVEAFSKWGEQVLTEHVVHEHGAPFPAAPDGDTYTAAWRAHEALHSVRDGGTMPDPGEATTVDPGLPVGPPSTFLPGDHCACGHMQAPTPGAFGLAADTTTETVHSWSACVTYRDYEASHGPARDPIEGIVKAYGRSRS